MFVATEFWSQQKSIQLLLIFYERGLIPEFISLPTSCLPLITRLAYHDNAGLARALYRCPPVSLHLFFFLLLLLVLCLLFLWKITRLYALIPPPPPPPAVCPLRAFVCLFFSFLLCVLWYCVKTKGVSFKAYSRSEYSHACFARYWNFFVSLFLISHSIQLRLFQILSPLLASL